MDGFQYKSTKPSEANSGGIIATDPNEVAVMKLRIIPTSEGYFDALNNQYIYNYTDHLGNVRLSYSDTNKDGIIQPRQYFYQQCDGPWDPFFPPNCISGWKPGEIVEVNDYYPFGLLHNYTTTTQNPYQYKYNGKELQETGMYDYGARFYMPDIGRWGVVDPLAELNRGWSPFRYGFNNPIIFIDPDGRNEDNILVNKETGDVKIEENNLPDRVYIVDRNNHKIDVNKDGNIDEGDSEYIGEDGTVAKTLTTLNFPRKIRDQMFAGDSPPLASDKQTVFSLDYNVATKVFDFIENNTFVEFSQKSFTVSGLKKSYLTTSHLFGAVYDVGAFEHPSRQIAGYSKNGIKYFEDKHSHHGAGSNPSGPDFNHAKAHNYTHILVNKGIYYKYDDKKEVTQIERKQK